jgi:serine/threonine protein kinase
MLGMPAVSPLGETHVRYVAQLDYQSVAERRGKLGKRVAYFLTLDGMLLSLFRNRSAPARQTVNVRMEAVEVGVAEREIRVPVQGKDRPLRLCLADVETAEEWRKALEAARQSHIEDFYTFGKTIGGGAFGHVVEAHNRLTNDRCAVKIIQRSNQASAKTREHLEHEMEVMKKVDHPGIVRTYHIFNLRRTIYIAMELVEGGDLFDFIAGHDSLTENQAIQVIRGILEAVDYLHRHQIVHRDLKPENILCVKKEWPVRVKLTDFGFAGFLDEDGNGSKTMKTQVGTAYFMAPEILSHDPYGPAVDCFACGVILYTMLTGRLPFPGLTTKEYWAHVQAGNARYPPSLWSGISVHAQNLVKGLLNKDPHKRLTAFAALQHQWIWLNTKNADSAIRRDRSNLHSRKRRLQKVRAAMVAITVMHRFNQLHEMHYGLDKVPEVVDAVGEGVKKAGEAIGEGVKKTGEVIESGVKKTGEVIESGVKKTGEGVKKTGEAIGDGVKKTGEVIGEGVKKTGEGVKVGVKKTGESVKKTGEAFGEGVKKTGEGVKVGVKKTGEGVKKTGEAIGEGLKKTGEVIEGGVKKTGEVIGEGVKKTGEGVKKTGEAIGDGVKKTGEGVKVGMKKTGEAIGDGVKKTGEGVKKTGEGVKAGVRKTGEGVKKAADGIGDGVKRTGDRLTPRRRQSSHPENDSGSTPRRRRGRPLAKRSSESSRGSGQPPSNGSSDPPRALGRSGSERAGVASPLASVPEVSSLDTGSRPATEAPAREPSSSVTVSTDRQEVESGSGTISGAEIVIANHSSSEYYSAEEGHGVVASEASAESSAVGAECSPGVVSSLGRKPNLPALAGLPLGLSGDGDRMRSIGSGSLLEVGLDAGRESSFPQEVGGDSSSTTLSTDALRNAALLLLATSATQAAD